MVKHPFHISPVFAGSWGVRSRGARCAMGGGAGQTWVTEEVEKTELRARIERDSHEKTDGEKMTLQEFGKCGIRLGS